MDTTGLKAYLPFNESATLDLCGNTWVAHGSPTLDTTIKKFGAASVHLPNGAYLTANNVIDLNADKWTFDAWAYCVSSGGDDGFIALSEGANHRGIIAGNDGIYAASSGGGSWQASKSSLLFPSVKNRWVHLAIVKNGTTVTFYQGGVAVWTFETSGLNNNGVFILGGSSYGYGSDIYFDEVRFYEGVALWTSNFTPPDANYYVELAIALDGSATFTGTFDVERFVANRNPSSGYWRYENPGSWDYILNHDNINTETVGFDKSVTGVAFWGGDRNDMVGVPAGCKELWVRLDLFLDAGIVDNYNTTSFSFGSTSSDSASINLCGYSNLVWTLPERSGWSLCIGRTMYFTLTPGAINSILLYLRSGKDDGMIQGTVKGTTATYTGYVNGGGDFSNLFFTSSKAAALYSNIVASNEPLSLEDGWHREPAAVKLNIKAVDLCVRKNGRTYVIPFSTTSNPPANSVVARVVRKTVYNPLVATTDENASALKVRYNGEDRALSASFN